MSESQTSATGEWLSPSAALNRLDIDEAELAHETAAELEPAEYQQRRHGVAIGPFSILLPPDTVCEVVQGSTIYPLPKTTNLVRGLLNLRGNLVPVFDLAEHFDAKAEASELPQILAVGKADEAIALIVDGIPKLASTSQPIPHSTLPLPEEIRNHVRGAYVEEDNMWLELDLTGLIESLTDQMEG